jgi:hypothetical protein
MNFSRVTAKIARAFNSPLFWIQVCALGIWILVIQNCREDKKPTAQRVYVVGGNIDAEVSGSVDVDNTVSVEVENIVRTLNW